MNDQPREPHPPGDVDEFYRRASALDPSRPGDHVRRTVLAHAEELASARARSQQKRLRWRPAVFGTLAAAVLAGLVIAPHWLSLRSPAASAPPPAPNASAQSQLAREAMPAAPTPAAPTPAAPTAAAPAPAAPAPATPPAAKSEGARIPAPPSRYSPSDSGAAAADANVAGEVHSNLAEIAAKPPSSSAARTAAAPAAPRAQIASQETLQQAADLGDLATLQRLLGANADIDARDAQGRTALMHAVLHGQERAVELLLAAGASTNAGDNDGTTPLQAAEASSERAIVEALRRYGAR
jgi:hypothetical protein